MSTNYVLVDFENLQPDMSSLVGTDHRVVVFFGAKQQTSRHHFDKFDSLFDLGPNLAREKILHSGKNALDMHIAYYVGRIFEREPGATVHVISRDTDFDPLLEYLRAKGFACSRSKDIDNIAAPARAPSRRGRSAPAVKAAPPVKAPPSTKAPATARSAPPAKKAPPDGIDAFVKQLKSMSGKPSNRRKLAQTLASYFKHHGGERTPKEIDQTLEDMVRRRLIAFSGDKVAYFLG